MRDLQRLAIAPHQRQGTTLTLTPEQSHYLSRVLRLTAGDRFIAMDGQGHWWLTQLSSHPDQAICLEELRQQTELPIPVVALVALPKGSGMDDVVRQLTEIGVSTLVPLLSDRTLLNPSPHKVERWRRIAKESAEQAERQVIPAILEPVAWRKSLAHWNRSVGHCYLCEGRGQYPHLWQCLQNQRATTPPPASILVATGPEGGWTADEMSAGVAAGFQPVSLGLRILKATTAPLVAATLIAASQDAVELA